MSEQSITFSSSNDPLDYSFFITIPENAEKCDSLEFRNCGLYPLDPYINIINHQELGLSGNISGNKDSNKLESLFSHIFCSENWQFLELGYPFIIAHDLKLNSYDLHAIARCDAELEKEPYCLISVIRLDPETFEPVKGIKRIFIPSVKWDKNTCSVDVPLSIWLETEYGPQLHRVLYPATFYPQSMDDYVSRWSFLKERFERPIRYFRPKISIQSSSNTPDDWNDTNTALFFIRYGGFKTDEGC